MSSTNKKFSPNSVVAIKEALSLIYWKREDLRDYLKVVIENSAIVGTLNWELTKKECVKELIERMLNRRDIYENDLMNLFIAVSDFNDFSNLDYWDADGSKRKRAESAVARLRETTKGHFQITKEQEEAKKRREDAEREIAKSKSLADDIAILKKSFDELSLLKNKQERGFALEKFLNNLFALYELDPKGAFKISGEQIDGAFTYDGTDYLLEAKWSKQVDRGDLAIFCHKVETKFKNAAGLLVTIDGLTPEAIDPLFKSIIIMDGLDIVAILDNRIKLTDLLYKKRRKASETGKIYVKYQDL
ncbi:MAG: hypothetical protein F9K23_07240 [Bacteroidetes bacterium]|nr:MAG: hypothetical protein F9K23_07240 [Bacteroidota bacterium]